MNEDGEGVVDISGGYLILQAECSCRKWPVLALTPMGKCGYCHETPVVR